MSLPKIDVTQLPDLNTLTGVFGSTNASMPGFDDRIIILMAYLYEILPPQNLI